MQSFSSRTRNIAVASSLLVLGVLHLPGPAEALDSVSLITDFGYNGRHAYFFVALDKGYYKAAGLDVKILRGQGSVDAIRQVGAGNATFGFADTGSLVLARANDQIPVKLVASVYARPPQAIFCREDSGIRLPKDLEERSIANPAGGSIPDLFPAYAKAAGIDASKVKWVIASSESLPTLLAANRTPCVGQFIVGVAPAARLLLPAGALRYADSGLNYYGNGCRQNHDCCQSGSGPAVCRCHVKGMKDAFARPDEAALSCTNTIRRWMPASLEEKPKRWPNWPGRGQPFGVIDPARIEATLDVMNGAFKLKTPGAAKDVYVSGLI